MRAKMLRLVSILVRSSRDWMKTRSLEDCTFDQRSSSFTGKMSSRRCVGEFENGMELSKARWTDQSLGILHHHMGQHKHIDGVKGCRRITCTSNRYVRGEENVSRPEAEKWKIL